MTILKHIKFMPFIKKYLKWVAGPLIIGITSFLIINPILKQLSGPDIYNIYVVGDFKNEKSSRDIRDEFIGEPYVMDTIKKLKIDCIFFAGTWQNALILINQVNAIYEDEIKKPKIILSDWCVDNKLIDQGKDAVNGVYLTQQMKRKDFEEKGEWGFYGKKATEIVERILNDARNNIKKGRLKKWLGIHRVEDARKAIKKSMFKLFYKNGKKYREQADFQVWQIKKIQTAEGNVEYKFMDWN